MDALGSTITQIPLAYPVERESLTAAHRIARRPHSQGGPERKEIAMAAPSDLPTRQVRTAFFFVEMFGRAGSIKSERNVGQINDMVDQANKYILQPRANITIVIYGRPKPLSMELQFDAGHVTREDGLNTNSKEIRSIFCGKRDGTAHFTAFCVPKPLTAEATFLPEQFCMIQDGVTPIGTNDVTYGAYCLAHAVGHLLNHLDAAREHSPNTGDLMYPIMELGGLNISPEDASRMYRGAG